MRRILPFLAVALIFGCADQQDPAAPEILESTNPLLSRGPSDSFDPIPEVAYVGGVFGPDITVFSVPDMQEVGRFDVPADGPQQLAISSNGHWMYVSHIAPDGVTKLDLDSYDAVATSAMPEGSSPFDLVVTPDGKRVFVTLFYGHQVAAIDAESMEVLALIPLTDDTDYVNGIAMGPGGQKIFVSSQESGRIHVLDSDRLEVTATIETGMASVNELAVTQDGRSVLGTAPSDDLVVVIDARSHEIDHLIPVQHPRGVAIPSHGREAYVTGNGPTTVIDLKSMEVAATLPQWGVRIALNRNDMLAMTTGSSIKLIDVVDRVVLAEIGDQENWDADFAVAPQATSCDPGPVVHVKPDAKNAFRSIGEALACVEARGQVLVHPGTYAEEVLVDKGVTIRAVGSGPAVVTPPADPSESGDLIHVVTTDPVVVEGLTMEGQCPNCAAVWGEGPVDLTVTGLRVFGLRYGPAVTNFAESSGARARLVVRDSYLDGGDPVGMQIGVFVSSDVDALVEGNVVRRTDFSCIQVQRTANADVIGNDLDECGPYGGVRARPHAGHEVNIVGNRIRNSTQLPNVFGIIYAHAGDYAGLPPTTGCIENNSVVDYIQPHAPGYSSAIYVSNGTTPTVRYNDIDGNAWAGLGVENEWTIDARHNWWGSADGPSGDGAGGGDAALGNALWEPWSEVPVADRSATACEPREEMPQEPDPPVVELFLDGLETPNDLAFDPEGGLFVSETGASRVRRIEILTDGSAGNAELVASDVSDAEGLALADDGVLYVSNGDVVYRVAAAGMTTFADGFQDPEGLAIDGNGDLYVADDFDGIRISRVEVLPDGTAGARTEVAHISAGNAADIEFGPEGDLYVADNNSAVWVIEFAPDGSALPAEVVASFSANPFSLALSPGGDLFVGTTGGTIWSLQPGSAPTLFASGLASVEGLAFDPQGRLFISNQGPHQILVVQTDLP